MNTAAQQVSQSGAANAAAAAAMHQAQVDIDIANEDLRRIAPKVYPEGHPALGRASGDLNVAEANSAAQAVSDAAWAPPVTPPPATVPGPVVNVRVTPGNGTLAISWDPPESDGGSAILDYTLSDSAGSDDTNGETAFVVSGLKNAVTYQLAIAAINAVGIGANVLVSGTPVAPVVATVPAAPTGLIATGGNGTLTLTFQPPPNNGFSAVSGYLYTLNGTQSTSAVSASPITITGLNNGTAYTAMVAAENAVGVGPNSAPATATPEAPSTTGASVAAAAAALGFKTMVADDMSVFSMGIQSAPGGGVWGASFDGSYGGIDSATNSLTSLSATEIAIQIHINSKTAASVGTGCCTYGRADVAAGKTQFFGARVQYPASVANGTDAALWFLPADNSEGGPSAPTSQEVDMESGYPDGKGTPITRLIYTNYHGTVAGGNENNQDIVDVGFDITAQPFLEGIIFDPGVSVKWWVWGPEDTGPRIIRALDIDPTTNQAIGSLQHEAIFNAQVFGSSDSSWHSYPETIPDDDQFVMTAFGEYTP